MHTINIVHRLQPKSDYDLIHPFFALERSGTNKMYLYQDINGSQECALTVSGEPKRTPKTPKKPKQSAKSVAPSAPPPPQSPIDSPQGKLKRSTARSLGTLPKLCNPSEIATVHRDHLSLLNNFLPLLQNISGEQFFHRVVQH